VRKEASDLMYSPVVCFSMVFMRSLHLVLVLFIKEKNKAYPRRLSGTNGVI
jgi:hypothetical protein